MPNYGFLMAQPRQRHVKGMPRGSLMNVLPMHCFLVTFSSSAPQQPQFLCLPSRLLVVNDPKHGQVSRKPRLAKPLALP